MDKLKKKKKQGESLKNQSLDTSQNDWAFLNFLYDSTVTWTFSIPLVFNYMLMYVTTPNTTPTFKESFWWLN